MAQKERKNKDKENGSKRYMASGKLKGPQLFCNHESMFSLQQGLAKDKVKEMRELILERYDKNYDGRLEINEVSEPDSNETV